MARRSGVSARMLRHYESLGLVRPTGRTVGGYREYSGEDIRRIFHIESLRSLGLSLREIGRALDDPGFTPSALVDDLVQQTRERIARETELLTRLSRVGAAGPHDWEDVLHVVALLQALGSKSAGRRQRAALSSGQPAAGQEAPVEALVEAALREADPVVAGTLRWALARAGGSGWELLAEGLGSADADVRKRAVQSLAEIPDAGATRLLGDALAHTDVVVRRYAALALGARQAAAPPPPPTGPHPGTATDPRADPPPPTPTTPAPNADPRTHTLTDTDPRTTPPTAPDPYSDPRTDTLTDTDTGPRTTPPPATPTTPDPYADSRPRPDPRTAPPLDPHPDPLPDPLVVPLVGTLLDMVVAEVNDVDAADVLGVLAGRGAEWAERIAVLFVDRLDRAADSPGARRRLTQALADIPGPTASRTLAQLAHDEDRAVSLTATYLLGRRDPG
ncbi:HEAT repeat domain-containing protein [Streptomyces sp. NPDC005900]|uniref:HEAT repeat domain-containing protein n=1 Tax=unclassified Streptomyces TaxID=2593676 RepID=UPI0033F03DEA